MTKTESRSQTALQNRSLSSGIVLLCCAASVSIALGGCSMRRKPSIPWSTAIQVRPVRQPYAAAASDVPEDPVPELRLELPPFPQRLVGVRNGPPRPHSSTLPSVGAGSDTEKLEAPVIAPQLAPEEIAIAQQQTNQSLRIAEKNLESVGRKSLNAAQADLVSKIKGFIKDSREAARIGDWTRARSLTKKAEVLSEELAGSL